MKLIVFLGNPGLKYRKTRHNIGFMMGDFLAKKYEVKFEFEKKFAADVAVIASAAKQSSLDRHVAGAPRDDKTLLVKPQKFYNLTGEVVQNLIKFYRLTSQDLLVICDDLNLEFGKIRLREQGSDGGNNGLKSIITHIGPEFRRIRIGTNNDLRGRIGDTDFVLSKFSREEQTQLPDIFANVTEHINKFVVE
ncbi:peptidyl-tRNA hydrolase [Alphaproteobacteria bacterium]|nr:peptidyl-tRNA hydrolase [Alphaproteobacteria bacterium]